MAYDAVEATDLQARRRGVSGRSPTGLPQAEGLRFPDSAHLPSVERAEKFTSDLRAWLGANGL